jgi:hypothetical protein
VSLNGSQLLQYVIRPALVMIAPEVPFSEGAAQLVLGTAMTESGLVYLDQMDKDSKPGPAFGLWQMEMPTFSDHLARSSPRLLKLLEYFGQLNINSLHGNLYLGAAMCRILYWNAPERVPFANDYSGMAEFWKLRYNTPEGKGTVGRALPFFKQACYL